MKPSPFLCRTDRISPQLHLWARAVTSLQCLLVSKPLPYVSAVGKRRDANILCTQPPFSAAPFSKADCNADNACRARRIARCLSRHSEDTCCCISGGHSLGRLRMIDGFQILTSGKVLIPGIYLGGSWLSSTRMSTWS